MNATTHGVLVPNVIPPSLRPYEDTDEFAAHVAGFYRQYAPANPMEDHLVQTIISCTWNLGRLARAQGGAIAQAQERAIAANAFRAEQLACVAQDAAAMQAAIDAGDMDQLRSVLDPHSIYVSCNTDQGALALADDQLRRCHAETRDQSCRDPQSALDRAALPAPQQALLFARYESHLQRQLHRSLATLHPHAPANPVSASPHLRVFAPSR